jgi:ribonuclease III
VADLKQVQNALNLQFRNPALLELALTHSSFLNEQPGQRLTSNERLEFLGDAVLGLFIADTLYRSFPDADEGMLTKYRSILVRRETLARLGAFLKLGDYLYLGRGEDTSGGRNKPVNLSRTLEALIAAVYLDQGSEAAGHFIHRLFVADIERLEALSLIADSKSQLQEIVQSRYQTTPAYSDTEIAGDSGEKLFESEVRVKGEVIGRGEGRTKKEAESRAARAALDQMENTLHPSEALLHLNSK